MPLTQEEVKIKKLLLIAGIAGALVLFGIFLFVVFR